MLYKNLPLLMTYPKGNCAICDNSLSEKLCSWQITVTHSTDQCHAYCLNYLEHQSQVVRHLSHREKEVNKLTTGSQECPPMIVTQASWCLSSSHLTPSVTTVHCPVTTVQCPVSTGDMSTLLPSIMDSYNQLHITKISAFGL